MKCETEALIGKYHHSTSNFLFRLDNFKEIYSGAEELPKISVQTI